jgi:hypothetical protein
MVVFDSLTGAIASPLDLLAKGVEMTMHARKLLLTIVAFFAGLTGLGLVLAEDCKPTLPPLNLKPGEPQVVIDAMFVQLPGEFFEELDMDNDPTDKSITLSPRETKMLLALIRMNPERVGLVHPHLCISDGQTEYLETGTIFELPVLEPATRDVKKIDKLRLSKNKDNLCPGFKLQVNARISKDSNEIRLGYEAQTTLLGGMVTLGQNGLGPVFHVQTTNGTTVVPDGGSVLFGHQGTKEVQEGGTVKRNHSLWMMTAHLNRGK